MSKTIETVMSTTEEPHYCFAPRRPAFGDFDSPVKVRYAIDETVSFHCNNGYNLLGPSVLTCVADGIWQPFAIPRCRASAPLSEQGSTDGVEKRCSILPDTNALTDTAFSSDAIYPVNFTINFYCPLGFVMKGPSQAICDANGKWQPESRPLCLSKEITNFINNQHNWAYFGKYLDYAKYISIPLAIVGMYVFYRKCGIRLSRSHYRCCCCCCCCCPKPKKIPVYQPPSCSTIQTTDSVTVIESNLLSNQPTQNQFDESPSANSLSACEDAIKNYSHSPTFQPACTLTPLSNNSMINK